MEAKMKSNVSYICILFDFQKNSNNHAIQRPREAFSVTERKLRGVIWCISDNGADFFLLSSPPSDNICEEANEVAKHTKKVFFFILAGNRLRLEKTEKHHPADKRELFKEVSEGHTTLLQGFCRGLFCCQKRNSVSHTFAF